MPEDVFRIVITVAVGFACIAFIVQAGVAIAFYRSVRKMQQTVSPLVERAGPVFDKIGPMMDKSGPLIDKAAPLIEKIIPLVEQIAPLAAKIGPAADKVGAAMVTANRILEENRPRVAQFADEAIGIAQSGRAQVEKIGSLLHEAGDLAATRLQQIDRTVESTVDQVEQVGDAMKRAVMRPVREVNGLAAGVSAVVSTLVRGRKYSVDSATQDEEMFI